LIIAHLAQKARFGCNLGFNLLAPCIALADKHCYSFEDGSPETAEITILEQKNRRVLLKALLLS
jgi:hypothetical protein